MLDAVDTDALGRDMEGVDEEADAEMQVMLQHVVEVLQRDIGELTSEFKYAQMPEGRGVTHAEVMRIVHACREGKACRRHCERPPRECRSCDGWSGGKRCPG